MAFITDQSEPTLPVNDNSSRSASNLLPRFFRTGTNKKFLSATIEQLISKGNVDKINAFIGRRDTKSRKSDDQYLEDVSTLREAYQLEPALVLKDSLDNVVLFKDYSDYINQLKFFGGNPENHSIVNSQEYYAWNPHFDWDKFTNFREYFWLPEGPQAITIRGNSIDIVSTYTVTLKDDGSNMSYVFTPDGKTSNPSLTLYKGQTYRFEINCPGHPMAFSTVRKFIPSQSYLSITHSDLFDEDMYDGRLYDADPWLYDENVKTLTTDSTNVYDIWTEGVKSNTTYVETGVIEFTVPLDAPDILYYVSKNDIRTGGMLKINDIEDASYINVETEIVGKKTYQFQDGYSLSNGMKIRFRGTVVPEKYATGNWYVEGVGNKIYLISDKDLELPSSFTKSTPVEFDGIPFDSQGFGMSGFFPTQKDYITINRGSKDRNSWSRSNRWVHRQVIEDSARVNKQPVDIDQSLRASRPIIEFEAGLQLMNYGHKAKADIDLIDNITTDVFSTIEGSQGYNIDEVAVTPGMRILFTADTDVRVANKIFTVVSLKHLNVSRLVLVETIDSNPEIGDVVLVRQGANFRGTIYHYTSTGWHVAQEKKSVNQAPVFDIFDSNEVSYADTSVYVGSSFNGTKLFSYKAGTSYDSELGQYVTYKNVGNIGDLLFDFNLHTDSFSYQEITSSITKTLDVGYLKVHDRDADTYNLYNGWTTAYEPSKQVVVSHQTILETLNFFPIDVYDNSGNLTDLSVTVFVNGNQQGLLDYEIFRQDGIAFVRFFANLTPGDFLVIETESSAPKNDNGFYKFPLNLEKNPRNQNLTDFTLGEVITHVETIASNYSDFVGVFPGVSNLRDSGPISKYGTRVVQHSSPLLPLVYHLTSKNFNIITALHYAKTEYNKFKKSLIRVASDYGFDGETRTHLDLVLKETVKDKRSDSPFYFSDMVPTGPYTSFTQKIVDDSVVEYPLIFEFDLNTPSEKAVLIYLNGKLLFAGTDYVFVNSNFVKILTPLAPDDLLEILQYTTTDGSFIPTTPTKLGLYPLFKPMVYVDTSYQTPTKVIQGHDGSITVAFNDYRDDLLLEYETRIYNNIKVKYDADLLNIHEYIEGFSRPCDVSREHLDSVLRAEFLKWSLIISNDYTSPSFYDSTNPFTFNYNSFSDDNGDLLPGFWRGIFKYYYDTDMPHVRPWEMLGFSEEPSWWKSVYGPAPYTKDNLILWNDLEAGIIKEPGKKAIRNPLYARPGLKDRIPVDSQGNLLSPLEANLVNGYVATNVNHSFRFGDYTPVETAWRRSVEFPFALLTAMILTKPAKLFATGFDRLRQLRDRTGQLSYKTAIGNKRFSTDVIVYPTVKTDTSRTFTSGLINYVIDYATSVSADSVNVYKNELSSITAKLSSKLGGFVSKDKFNLMLDSRSPMSDGTAFVPAENYEIILNTSSPVYSIDYSGVIIEKRASGFIIRGYSQVTPEFSYFEPIVTASDPVLNVGGISEIYTTWAPENYYTKGSVIKYDSFYYRTGITHQSSSVFEEKYFIKLPKLPVTGGRDIVIRKNFSKKISKLHYGSELKTVQDVVDFLLGYGEYLISEGFDFSYFNADLSAVTDWQLSVREFAFWTTQHWAAGSIISLSPGSDQLKFQKSQCVVDNLFDNFYDYSIFCEDGTPLVQNFAHSSRTANEFSISPGESDRGIYHATLNLVQKEHVLILDDVTLFNDVIYNQTQGYRQERIKVLGYRTSDWQGDFNIPGFVFDNSKVIEWEPWTDYNIGQPVKYKEFYYGARTNLPGTEEFEIASWYKLNQKPSPSLMPNWDYRADQFLDFYDLDSDNFEASQQKFAQHLIGYQKRQYLENIISDDISQYKFYQGMIREKGVQSCLSKLFDALNTSDNESLEFYEEWAIRLGQYGASAGFEEVEFILDEEKFLLNPQPVEITSTSNDDSFVYQIDPQSAYVSASKGTNIFPTVTTVDEVYPSAGYVTDDDVKYIIKTPAEFQDFNINSLVDGDRFWVGFDKTEWNVYRYTFLENRIKVETTPTTILLYSSNLRTLKRGSYIGFTSSNPSVSGIFPIMSVKSGYVEIEKPSTMDSSDILAVNNDNSLRLYGFVSIRMQTIDDYPIKNKKVGELAWVDGDNDWKIYQFNPMSAVHTTITESSTRFGSAIVVNDDSTMIAVKTASTVNYHVRNNVRAAWGPVGYLGRITGSMAMTGLGIIYLHDTIENEIVGFKYTRPLYTPFGSQLTGNGTVQVCVYNEYPVILNSNEVSVYLADLSASLSTVSIPTGTIHGIKVSNSGHVLLHYQIDEVYYVGLYSISTAGVLSTQIKNIQVPKKLETDHFDISGLYVAIGDPQFSGSISNQGKVDVYYNLEFGYSLYSVNPYPSELFGAKVMFDKTASQLFVYSKGGTQFNKWNKWKLTDDVIFDYDLTNFYLSQEIGVGSVSVFDRIDTKFLYATNIEIMKEDGTPGSVGSEYGSAMAISNHLFIGDPVNSGKGSVYEFASVGQSWKEYKTQGPRVDVSKMKTVFVYNTLVPSEMTYLDIIDPIAGKILGLAEQELRFKTSYDPASYSVGTDELVVDPLSNWEDENIGRLWWDLSTVKFVMPYDGTCLHKSNIWNHQIKGSSVDVYEWVSSPYMPSEWDELADTEEGLTLEISGKSKYGDAAYCVSQKYDSISKTYSNTYYFWVKNKKIIPHVPFRNLSARDVATYISDPQSSGIQYVTLVGPNQFALVNCATLVTGKKTAINFRFWTIDNKEINIHSHYQLFAEGTTSSKLNPYIEKKWFDSLVGYDELNNEVPDPTLPTKLKYGVLSRPRQGMFIDRIEAVKQLVNRINLILKNSLLSSTSIKLELLSLKDTYPSIVTGKYDIAVNSYNELQYIGLNSIVTAKLTPVISEAGKLVNVIIQNPGYGYKTAPTVEISGSGIGAAVSVKINKIGEVISVMVEKEGSGYTHDTTIIVRPFTVLVTTDESANGQWVMYSLVDSNWVNVQNQKYDISQYWDYIDWYETGYNGFTKIDHVVDYMYQLPSLNVQLGEIVKVNYDGASGWTLLKKIDTKSTTEVTVNYSVIGKENGTIQFNDKLYATTSDNGFDTIIFDNNLYDLGTTRELRYVLNCIRDSILIGNLEVEYNKLFFSSLRYIFSEQPFVDWIFKTSFVSAKHNLGELTQWPTYQRNKLSSYEAYVNEVKPYRSKIREFVSNFEKLESTHSSVTDFDLPTRYNFTTSEVSTFVVKEENGNVVYDSADILNAPFNAWYDNVGTSVTEIRIVDSGLLYRSAPSVVIEGVCKDTAEATAYISNGKVSKIVVTDPGSGYIRTPVIKLLGGYDYNGTEAKAVPIMGNSLVRSMQIGLKFDRISPTYASSVVSLTETESFTGTGVRSVFDLKWPMSIKSGDTIITVNGTEILRSDFTVTNVKVNGSFTKLVGRITFNSPGKVVPVASKITIRYQKDVSMLDAADRIQYYYEPTSGQLGKDLGQLMTGVDYGGVEVTGVNFDSAVGWDVNAWGSDAWDNYDPNYTDHHVYYGGENTIKFVLPYTLDPSESINVYWNNSRIDSSTFDTFTYSITRPIVNAAANELSTAQSALDSAIMSGDQTDIRVAKSIVEYRQELLKDAIKQHNKVKTISFNDVVNTVVTLDVSNLILSYKDKITFRRESSDGSVVPSESIFDLSLSGGDITYNSAKGLAPEDIVVDGDGFVTSYTSHAPEEVIPGHVVDTVSITVYHRHSTSDSFVGDGVTSAFVTSVKYSSAVEVQVVVDGHESDVTNIQIDGFLGFEFDTPPVLGSNIEYTVAYSQLPLVSGFNIFKDMLNQHTYKRLDDSANTVLAMPLHRDDYTITVEDASALVEPNAAKNLPGIIFIENERIEYFTKTGNVLGQLRRGTMGTGIGEIYSAGAIVRDASSSQTIPESGDTTDVKHLRSYSTFTGMISGTTLIVDSVTYGSVEVGQSITGTHVLPNTTIIDKSYNADNTISYIVDKSHSQFDMADGTIKNLAGELIAEIHHVVVKGNQIFVPVDQVSSASIHDVQVGHVISGPYIFERTIITSIDNDSTNWIFEVNKTQGGTGLVELKGTLSRDLYVDFIPKKSTIDSWFTKFGDALPKGEFSSTLHYNIGDIVSYNGFYYKNIAKYDINVDLSGSIIPTSITPLNTIYWKQWSTIPVGYGQCNEVEVFVGGRRLRKNPILSWDVSLGPDSEDGTANIKLDAEFTVDGVSNVIRLTSEISDNVEIQIVRKTGQLWTPSTYSLSDAETAPAQFICKTSASLPQ